ncbi:hypothetical protein ACHWQZ_G015848 [Mnemiopsis leidyi]
MLPLTEAIGLGPLPSAADLGRLTASGRCLRQRPSAGVTAVNQEQLQATEAKISCTVSGLTKALDDVKWTKSDDTPITSGVDGFVIADGTLSGNSQTTILTVPGSANTLDTTYKCLITSTEHGKTDDSTTVSLKVFTLTPTTKQVTTAVDQSLTCVIGELEPSGDPVTVTWKDPSGVAVSDSDTTNYGLAQGTVDGSGVQNAVLTIKVAKLSGFSSSFTYKCSAQYTGSPSSGEIEVVADILTFGVTAVNQEQLQATEAKISCTVSGLTKALDDVKWTKSDDTPITSGVDGFVIADGTLSGNSQTTILTVPGSANTLDTTYKCLITSTEHGKTDDSTTVSLKVFTLTPTTKQVTTAVDQSLTCVIGELEPSGDPVTVTWKDPSGVAVSDSDTTNYGLAQGTVDGSGVQNAVLTIKVAKLSGFSSSFTYKCSAQYTGSPSSGEIEVVADILTFGVTAVNQEQLKATEAKISCTVSGLTKALDDVKWTKSDDTPITSGVDGFVIADGTLSGNSQTTILTVPGSANTLDTTYKCLITSTEHGKTDDSTTVSLKVFTLTSTTKQVTTAVDQTLTCVIGELEPSGDPVTVTWKDPSGVAVSDSDTTNYGLAQGTVDGSGVQNAVLTIKVAKLSGFSSSFTYKCSAQYTGSPSSGEIEVVADILTFGVTAVNQEQLKATEAKISCTVSGLTKALDDVKWTKSDDTPITSGVDGFVIADGTLSGNSQTTILTVPGSANTLDTTYKCLITSTEHGKTDDSTTVSLKVFTLTSTTKQVTTAVDQTLTCVIGELEPSGDPVTVTWKDPSGVAVLDSDTTNYGLAQGTVDGSGVQNAVLTIKVAKLSGFSSSFTYKCSAQYTGSPSSGEIEVVADILTFGVTAVNQEQLQATEAKISCTVSGLTKALDDVKWTKSDDTPITSGVDGFVIADGTLSGNSQTTILTVPGSANTLDTTYKCLITSTEHGKTDDSTTVSLKVFTLTSTTKQVTTAVDQSLTCVIGELEPSGDPVTVTWKDPSGVAVSDSDTTNYGLAQGTVDGSGVQNAVLTIKVAKLSGFSSSFTYKCSAQYTGSPSSGEIEVVADILTFGVTAVNQEQLKATEAKISCTVSGLTKALDDVKWTKSDDTPITSGVDGFVIADGTLSGNSQTTILTVPGSANTLDTTYKCLITSTEHGKTDDSTTVSLKVFTLTSTTKQVTTAVDQTLTCVIGELEPSGDPVTVTWKDPSGVAVLDSDTTNYGLAQGTVDGSGVQNAVLTIKVAKLSGFSSSFTYKCSAQYTGSPSSGEIEVVADILTFGVTAVNQEQLQATEAKISCTVSGLTKALDDVKWTKSDDTPITSGVDGFVIADGTLSGNSQTTILTVPGSANTLDTTYKCLITSTEHGKTDDSTTVSLKVFTLTSTTKQVTTAVDQSLTCVIGELEPSGDPVTVTWKDPNGVAVSDSDTTNYGLAQGTVDGSGVQNAVLTIKVAKLSGVSSSFTYKCSAQYTGSPSSGEIEVVADILTFGVTAVNQEQLKATEAKISCTVSGLTKALDDVKWTKSDDTPITSGVDGFVIADGTLSGNSQTTILTVPGSANTLDTTYKCLITSTEHGKTDDSTTVSLKVFTLNSTTKQVTTAVDQTLTCVIGELEPSGDPVIVTWKDPSGVAVLDSDTTNYGLAQGTVDGSGVQNAVLTIKVAKLSGFSSSFTYKCSAQYTGSPSSGEIEVVADILTFGVTAVNQEQLKATEAKISCTVSGLTKALDDVKWTKSDDTPITSGVDGFVIADGTLSGNSQTTILTVPGSANTLDTTYKCLITSTEHGKTDDSTTVSLKVFTLTSTTKQVTTAVDQTLTCVIGELEPSGDPVTVTWKDPSGVAVSDSDTTNYGLAQGTVDGSGVQNAVLTIKVAKLSGFSSSFTYKCSAQYTGSPSSGEIEVVADILTFGVTAVNQEQLKATEAKISCTVSGLTKALDDVKWTKSDDTPITSGVDGFVIADGTLSGNSLTTILTVPGSANTLDTTYKCLITSTEHGKTDDSTTVSLKVFTLTSTTKQVTTAVDQTLTCVIGGLEPSGDPVTVTWKDPSGVAVSDSDTTNYGLAQGTVDGSGVQNAVLTIKVAKLSGFSSSFTYKCSAQYTGSPSSGEIDVVADILTFGVAAVNQEQLKDTEAKISCTVSGLTKALDEVKWTKSDDTPITSGEDDFVIDKGTLSGNSQTTILTIPAAANTADATYNCLITSDEHGKDGESTSVRSNVFSLSTLDTFYYSPTNVEVTVEGRYEPEIAWSVNGQVYSQSDNPNLTPTVKTAWDGSKKVFNLAFDMTAFPADMAEFEISATISLGDASSATFPVGPFTVYKREFTQSLSASVTFTDDDLPKVFDCSAQGEDKALFSLSWQIGTTAIDGDFDLATITDTSDSSSETEKKSQLSITANNHVFNDELKCVATWTGKDSKAIETKTDVNAIGASMAGQTFSDGTTGDGVMKCVVWGDVPPHSVSWKNPSEETLSNVANEVSNTRNIPYQSKIVIADSTEGAVYTHTLTIKDVTFGDQGQYTCLVVFSAGETAKTLTTQLSKLSASFVPSSPYFVHDNAVVFSCIYNGLEDPSKVEWFKGSTDEAENLISDGDKYEIVNTDFNTASRTKTSVITFKNVAVTDTGDYTCKWDTGTFDPKATMTVAIRSLTTPTAKTYSTDGSIKVTCNYEGTSSGSMEWFHGDQKLVDTEGDYITINDGTLESNAQTYTLTISNANPETNSGEYECVLSFVDGDKLKATTDVVVRKATAIDSKGDVESSIVVSDGELSARCLFEGTGSGKPSNVKWSKGGVDVVFDSVTKIQNTNTKSLTNSIEFFSNITLKNFVFADEGSYTCTFEFADGNNVETSVNAISAAVSNDECVFVNLGEETSKTLSCTYSGADQVTGVTFTLPGGSEQTGQLGAYTAGGDAATAGTQTGTYTLTRITAAYSGAYTCTFTLNDGSSVSAIQRLTARQAVIESSDGLTPRLIVRASITLTCTVASGAKSIEWLKDGEVLTEGTDYKEIKVEVSKPTDKVSKMEFDIAADSAGTYKCRGTQYDDFCPTQRQFESEGVVLTIITATPLENPADATAYGGGSHTFTCKFPNPFVGQTYEIVWSFKGAGDSVTQPMIGNGDVYENGERIIDGTISKDHTTTSGEISTELAIANVDTNVAGEYLCTIKWGTIFIKSNPATLTVRTISEPPMTTNVVKGGEAKFTCKTTGDAEGTITFHNAADNTPVGSVVATPVTVAGVVTTTGVLTIAAAADSDSFEYYCKATWSGKEVKSANVFLAVLGITETTPTAWGVESKLAQFECKSDAVLKKNAGGDALLDADGDNILAAATITWEYYDTLTTTWKASTEDNRFRILNSNIGNDGIRVSHLTLRNLNSNEDGLKVRCKIAYDTDAENHLFGATVTSSDITLKIAQIISVSASDVGPTTGDTITLTCVAVGESAPTFKFFSKDKSSLDETFFQEVEALAETSESTTHTAVYVTKAIAPNVLRNGEVIICEADYGRSLGTSTKDFTVTTYFDCSKVTVKSKNPDRIVATVTETDNGDGTLTQTISCPADTDTARYNLITTTNSAASITCSKSTGKYNPPFLARCEESRKISSGHGQQLMNLAKYLDKPCSPAATGEISKDKVIAKLNSMTDTNCGFRHLVPCLLENKCTLDTEKTVCLYDPVKDELQMDYYVTLNTPVWTISERDALVQKEEGKFKFWGCSDVYRKRRRRDALENVFEKLSANKTFVGDALQSKHYVAATAVGGCAVVMVTALLTVLFVRLRRKRSQDMETVDLANN